MTQKARWRKRYRKMPSMLFGFREFWSRVRTLKSWVRRIP